MIKLKKGDSFLLAFQVQDDDGAVLSLVGYSISSQVRTSTDQLVAQLDVEVTDAVAGQLTVGASSTSTSAWPVGKLLCDLRIDLGGDISHSETFEILVQQAVTR